jgi:hypothetical protein
MRLPIFNDIYMIKKVLLLFKRFSDTFLKLLFFPIAELAAFSLRYTPGNSAYRNFYRHGFHLLRQHYYVPIPQSEDMNNSFQQRNSELVGLEIEEELALKLLREIFPHYLAEFRAIFPIHQSSKDPRQFYLINSNFMAIDAHVYYAFIRHFKPKRIVEVGAGNSTILAAVACRKNSDEGGVATNLTGIEPFPRACLKHGLPGLSKLIKDKIQNTDMQLFTSLEAGDILFIDSSHVLRSGGDVQVEYCEILPRLAPGVLVHIHDISLPKPYPRVYFENQLYFNEQYLLQAFLCFNSRFEVIWPGNYLMVKYPEEMSVAFPEYREMRRFYPMSEPSSFWMRVKT